MGEWDDMLGRGEYAPIDWRTRAEQAEEQVAHWKRVAGRAREQAEGQEARAEQAEAEQAYTYTLARKAHDRAGQREQAWRAAEDALRAANAHHEAALSRVLADVEALADEWEQESPVTSPWYVAELRALVDKHTGGDQS